MATTINIKDGMKCVTSYNQKDQVLEVDIAAKHCTLVQEQDEAL